jgi:hypothetical protein
MAGLLRKAGPEGGEAHKALRAWRSLVKLADERGLSGFGLPASEMLVADVVALEMERAHRAARGSRGGRTVGTSFREGFR